MEAKKLWDAEKKTPVDVATIATAWGYSSVSGRVRTKLGALRKYGLLEDTKDGARVSELAIRILYAVPDTSDYIAFLREAALKPSLFRELYETHSGASEQAVKAYLVVKRGFSDKGASEAAKAFKESLEVAKLVDSDYTPLGSTSEEVEDDMASPQIDQSPSVLLSGGRVAVAAPYPSAARSTPTGTMIFAGENTTPIGDWIPVSSDCKMRVWADGVVTKAGIKKLIKYLELIEDSFPESASSLAGDKPV
jgi:hypothetical protein